jgi:TRAP-type mannitol/chloroaromatic compound transport system permease large subunit
MEFIAANMAPLMFGALVVFMLFGYPVAFALAANGVVFGLIGIELGLLTPALFQACRTASSGSCPTTPCWRFPSSPSWA